MTAKGRIHLYGEERPARILVKFYTKRKEMIPEGIEERRVRMSPEAKDRGHAEIGRDAGLSDEQVRVGRLRPGRVDTDDPVIEAQMADGSALWKGLHESGWAFYDTAYVAEEKQKHRGGTETRYTVQYIFIPEELTDEYLEQEAVEERAGFEKLATGPWQRVFVYDNKNTTWTTTANFTGPQVGSTPKHKIGVMEGAICVTDGATKSA